MTAGASASCASRSILPTAFEDGPPAATRPSGAAADRQSSARPTRLCHGELNCLNFDSPTVVRGPAIAGHCSWAPAPRISPSRRARRAAGGPSRPTLGQGHFLTLAYHDVEDEDPDRAFSVRTDRLVDQLNWLRENGRRLGGPDPGRAPARRQAPLERAVLLTFDDGYRSFLTRVLPILKAYGWPAVLAPVGTWMDTPADRKVDFGGNMQPRDRFLDWNDVREISRSGWWRSPPTPTPRTTARWPIPRAIPRAAAVRKYDARNGRYENEAGFEQRMGRDVAAISERSAAPPARRRASGSGPMAPRAAPRCASPANRVIRWR